VNPILSSPIYVDLGLVLPLAHFDPKLSPAESDAHSPNALEVAFWQADIFINILRPATRLFARTQSVK
jgi:hypothetical protein